MVVQITDLAPLNKKSVIRVLHVDDELGLLEVSKQILLMENNFEIDNVTSVAEAFKKMEQQKYDAIVSDYEMPQKNGLEFLKELREKNNQIPFILFTGRGREDVAVKALNLGADSYINKNGSIETVYCELADAINKTVERKKSRELLAKSESKYHALVENSLQGIAILQAAPLKLVFSNGAFGKILGYSPEELTSLSPEKIMSLVYHEDRAVFFKRMENRLQGEPAEACFEFRAVRKDGSIIWLSSLANRIDYDGQPAVQGMFLDINESKIAAEILRESEQKYRELANCLPDIVFETDINGQVEFANDRAAEISGYSLNEIEKGVNIFQFIVPEDRERATKNIQRLLQGGSYVLSEYKFIRKDSSTFPVLVTATPRVCKNKVTGFRGIALDISERKKAEEIVKKSEARYRELANFLPEIVFETDLSGKITFFSQNAFETTGYTPDEIEKGLNMLQFVVPEDRERAKENIRRRMAGEKSDTSEYRLFRKNGDTYPAIVKTAPIFSENRLIGLRGLVIDITERKKTEEALKTSEMQFRQLFSNMPSGVAVYEAVNDGKDFIFRDFNAVAERIEKIKREKVIGKRVTEVFPGVENFGLFNVFKQVWQSGESEYYPTALYKDDNDLGTWRENWVYKLPNGNIVAIYNDITERKKAEDEFSGKEKRFRAIFDKSFQFALILDIYGNVLEMNELCYTVHGPLAEGCLGKPFWKAAWWSQFPEVAEKTKLAIQNCQVGKIVHDEVKFFDKDLHIHHGIRIFSPITDENGKLLYISVVGLDISERKKAEDALADSEARYRALVENADDTILLTDLRGKHIYRNHAYYKSLGYEEGDNVELDGFSKMHPDDVSIVKEKMSELLKTGSIVSEYRVKHRDGRWLNRFAKSTLIYNVHNQPYAILAIVRDVTERKKAEEELKKDQVQKWKL